MTRPDAPAPDGPPSPRTGAGPELELGARARAVLEALEAHETVRAFRPDPVPDALVERCVRAAQRTATSSWTQAYHLLQVTRPAERERLAELCGGQAQVAGAGAFFVLCADARRHALVAEAAGEPHRRNLEVFLLAALDAALFAQSLTLAFESAGLGTCYIGGLRNQVAAASALLELPDGVWPLFGLCAGTPREPAGRGPVRPRLDPGAVWTRDRYPADDEVRSRVAAHDRDAGAFYAETGRPGRDWSVGIVRKFHAPLREDLRAAYEALGARFE